MAQSLRPFPQFTTLTATGGPLGKTWYDSLQLKATKRFSHGVDFTWTYTRSKELQLGADDYTGLGHHQRRVQSRYQQAAIGLLAAELDDAGRQLHDAQVEPEPLGELCH